MAQYKAAMARIYRTEEDMQDVQPRSSPVKMAVPAAPTGPLETYICENFEFLMRFCVPLLWILLFVSTMDHDSFVGNLYITFIGIFAAILANAVPIGGGVVYVPALALLGVNLHLGVAFSVATMTFGNGVFGFLKWVHKDPSLVVWESFLYTVVPSSIGSFIAIVYFPPLDVSVVRTVFAVFCLCLAALVLMAVYRGGSMDRLLEGQTLPTALTACTAGPPAEDTAAVDNEAPTIEGAEASTPAASTEANTIPSSADLRSAFHAQRNKTVSTTAWTTIAGISFLAGALLVPNIAVGPALTTFLALQLVGYAPRRAIVTGIITGGWVSLVPFLLHLLVVKDVPVQLWVMVLPGVYIGSQIAPYVHDYIGLSTVLSLFALFLLATAYLFFQ